MTYTCPDDLDMQQAVAKLGDVALGLADSDRARLGPLPAGCGT
jgi:hypothetical protein